MSGPDLIILHSNDAAEWDHYLSDCFKQDAEPECIDIIHEKLEDLPFPLPSARVQSFSSAKAILVILSPDFLDFIDSHPEEVFDMGKLLKKNQTVAMLCGIKNSDVTSFHKASLVSYDSWPHLIARDQDRDFVLTVIHTTHEILERTSSTQKAQFKLAPRKVKEGNGKVFVILSKPLNEKQKIQVFLEGEGVREVPLKLRNPYTIQFIVPDSCMQGSKLMNVLVRCDDYLLGVRPLKCESKMGELYSLLSVVNSPYELLCRTMGVGSLHEMDSQLAKNFQQNLPPFGFSLLGPNHDYEKKKSEEELPTLLHFAARYGLKELSSQLLQCPGAAQACRLRNTRGLIPSQLANHAGYTDIAELLEDFATVMEPDKALSNSEAAKQFNLMTVVEPDKVLPTTQDTKPALSTVYEQMQDCPSSLYDVPFPVPIPTSTKLSSAENDYLGMFGFGSFNVENLEPHKRLLMGIEEPKELSTDIESPEVDASPSTLSESKSVLAKKDILCGSQKELIDIMEAYKKGVPFSEVSSLYECWQNKHRNSIDAGRDEIETLRKLYKECQKKQTKKMSGFTEVRHMLSNIIGRKDSKSRSGAVKTYQRPTKRLEKSPEDGIRPVSTLSTVSSASSSSSSSSSSDRCSTLSMSSIYDSGNHSDSCDEGTKTKDAAIGNDPHNSSMTQSTVCERPPAPPPRPSVPPPISRDHDKKNLKHSYYMFPPIMPRNEQGKLPSPDYVLPDNGCCISSNQSEVTAGNSSSITDTSGDVPPLKEKPSNDKTCNNAHNQVTSKIAINKFKSLSLSRRHSCTSSTSPNIKQSDECQYYDIPALPVPICDKSKEKQFSLSEVDNSNYDIPRPLAVHRLDRKGSLSREPTYIEVLVNEDQNARGDSLDYDVPKLLKQDKTRHSPLTREITTYTGVINPKQRKETCSKAGNYYNVTCFQMNEDQYDSIPDEMPPPPPTDDDPYSVMMPSSIVQRCITPPLPPRIKISANENK